MNPEPEVDRMVFLLLWLAIVALSCLGNSVVPLEVMDSSLVQYKTN